jgi:hypothetical protein
VQQVAVYHQPRAERSTSFRYALAEVSQLLAAINVAIGNGQQMTTVLGMDSGVEDDA